MPNVKRITLDWSETGITVYCIVRREADDYRLDDSDGSFAASPADPYLSLAEDAVIKGRYEEDESRGAWDDGRYTITVYKQDGGSPVPASDIVIGTGEMVIKDDAEVYVDAPMRGTDSAALAAVCTEARLVELASGNIPSDIDTLLTRITDARMGALTDWINGGRLDIILDAIVADTNELQVDWADAGRLDTILDARATASALSTHDGKLDTVDTVVDAIKAVTDLLPDSGALSSLATAAALATVDTVVDGIQADLSNPTDGLGALKALIDALNDPTVAAIADAIWDEAQAGHTGVGSFGKYLDTEVSGVGGASAAAIADAVWNEARSGHVTQGSFGESFKGIVKGTVDTATFTPTTIAFEADDITEATADHYNGRSIVFLTGALAGQATPITDYVLANSKGKFTVTAMTEAPGNNAEFIII